MAINRATFSVTGNALEFMVLEKSDSPPHFRAFNWSGRAHWTTPPRPNRVFRAAAQQDFPGSTEEKFRSASRANGVLREFGPTGNMPNHDRFDFLGSTVAHLFDDPASVPG